MSPGGSPVHRSRKDLNNALRRILRSDSVSLNEGLIRENVFRVVDCFNSYYNLVLTRWESYNDNDRKQALVKFASDRHDVECCLKRVPDLATKVIVPTEISGQISWSSGDKFIVDLVHKPEEETSSITSSDSEEFVNTTTMDAFEIIKLVNSTFRPFDGKAEELGAFLVNLEIIEEALPATQLALGIKCVRGKLLGAAEGFVPSTVSSFQEIASALKANIRQEPSSVIEARLAAISFDNYNLTKFAEEVEKAATLLHSTLIHEGVPIAKSNEMTIAKVVETCRRSARNDLVRAVLASSTFDTPKAVLSKFITEVAEQNKDKQFLALRQQSTSRGNNRGNYRQGDRRFQRNRNDYYSNQSQHQGNNSNQGREYNRGGYQGHRGQSSNRDNYSGRTAHVRYTNGVADVVEDEHDHNNPGNE